MDEKTTPESGVSVPASDAAKESTHQALLQIAAENRAALAANPPEQPYEPRHMAATTSGPAEAKLSELGASAGARVDMIADKGRTAVVAGREKLSSGVDSLAEKAYDAAGAVDRGVTSVQQRAERVRERVKNGAELVAEKHREAVSAAKEKSQRAMLAAIGLSISAEEKLAEVPDRVKDRGRKIGKALLKFGAKAFESISGRASKTKERIMVTLNAGVEKTAAAVDSTLDKGNEAFKNWEQRLQTARIESEAAAERARVEVLKKDYIEASIEATKQGAEATYTSEVAEAANKRDATIEQAQKAAESRVEGLSADQILVAMEALAKDGPDQSSVFEADVSAPVAEADPVTAAGQTEPENPIAMPVAA